MWCRQPAWMLLVAERRDGPPGRCITCSPTCMHQCEPPTCCPGPQVLTGDQGGTLCVWSVHTGRLRLKLPYVHGEHQRISAMCLDHNCRRLFTASEGGPIKVGTGQGRAGCLCCCCPALLPSSAGYVLLPAALDNLAAGLMLAQATTVLSRLPWCC